MVEAIARQHGNGKDIVLNLRRRVVARLQLAKAPLCLALGFSTLFGYLLASPSVTGATCLAVAGVICLAGGAATLNSLQEMKQDGLMTRTRNRPLPRGELTVRQARGQAVVLISAGLVLLLPVESTPWPAFLGLFALFLYNSIYTVLKRRTSLALIPGAICGGLPPVIGWLAGGGHFFSATTGMLLLLLVLWQIPHFWLIMLRYRQDYQRCKLPTLLNDFSEHRVQRLFLLWIAALVLAMVEISLLPSGIGSLARALIIAASILMAAIFLGQFIGYRPTNYRVLFIVLNTVFFFNMLVIGGSRLL